MNYRKGFERLGYALSAMFSLTCFTAFLFCRGLTINDSEDLVIFLCVSVATCLVSFTVVFVPYALLMSFLAWIAEGFKQPEGECDG